MSEKPILELMKEAQAAGLGYPGRVCSEERTRMSEKPILELMKEAQAAGLGYPGSKPDAKFTNAFQVGPGIDGVDPSNAWILTYTGKQFFHLAPTVEMICIEDIAHSLALTARWTGHTKWHYSVAQHVVLASYVCPPEFAFPTLMHDNPEAYIGDMNRPLKHFTPAGVAYCEIEERIEKVMAQKYNLPFPMPPAVKEADVKMLYAERAQLMNFSGYHNYEARKWGASEEAANIRIERWTPRRAEKMFLRRFAELTNK